MSLCTPSWEIARHLVTPEQVLKGYNDATVSMTTLNLQAARLMHKHGAHAATDVTGFGLAGHAGNLAEFQEGNVDFRIHTLPIFANFARVCAQLIEKGGRNFKLLQGLSSETSGGLLVSLSPDSAEAFVKDMVAGGGTAWVVGDVVEGTKTATIAENPNIIEVSY